MSELSRDLFLAILAMDSYNRGYGAGIGGLSDNKGTLIGSAEVKRASSSLESSPEVAAGFYAVAYDTQYGTVISYRGTDFSPQGDLQIDGRYGWAIGGGNYTNNQAKLSTDFLDAVQAGQEKGSVILTGHSLGGGLAGFNSELFHNDAVIFDPMPYLAAVENLVEFYTREPGFLDPISPVITIGGEYGIWGPVTVDAVSVETARRIAQEVYRASLSPLSDEDYQAGDINPENHASGYYLPGEVLDIGLTGLLTLRDQNDDYPFLVAAGLTDASTNKSHVPGGYFGSKISLHSMSALILQMFSDENGQSESWLPIHRQVMTSWFSEDIAQSIKPDDISSFLEGYGISAVLSAIAYSALDEGNLIFGDTGIRAMFDDLDELGYVYNSTFDSGRDGLLAANDNQGNRGAIGRAA